MYWVSPGEPSHMVDAFCDRCGEKWKYTGDRRPGTYVGCPPFKADVEMPEE